MRKPLQIVDFITLGACVVGRVHMPQNQTTGAASVPLVTTIPTVLLGLSLWHELGDSAQGAWWAMGLLPWRFVT